MTRYRLAIFDFDGTLADSADWAFGVMNEVARRYDFREIGAEEREALRGRPNREVIRALGVPVWRLPLIAAHMRGLVRESAERIPLFPWTSGLLAELADAGVTLAIASSNDPDTILRILGPEASARVSAVAGGASLFGKAAKFRRLVRQFGVGPAETVCVGDEHRDVEAAQQAGLASIAVTWGFATVPALVAAGPTALAADPGELVRLILSDRS